MAIRTATATFNGVDSVPVTWDALTTNPPAVTLGVGVLDGATVEVEALSVTTGGCTVQATAAFYGVVEVISSD